MLDEADRMLSQGFAKELSDVLALLPTNCRKLLFPRLFPRPWKFSRSACCAPPSASRSTLGLIRARRSSRNARSRSIRAPALRCCATCSRPTIGRACWCSVASRHGVEHVASKLTRAGFSALSLHGELSQAARVQALDDLKGQRVRVVVATDLAARGLDIAGLSAVINYDLPRSPTDYAHRIGRTGRAGESGIAISLIGAENAAIFG